MIFAALAVSSSALPAQTPQLEQAQKLFLLGRSALEKNDAPKAVDFLEKAIALNSRSSEYYDWLGKAYGTQAQKAGKLKQPFLAKKTKDAWEKARSEGACGAHDG